MDLAALFCALVVSHLAGDFLLQTEFQALNKRAGLSRDPLRRKALLSHGLTYTLAFAPVLSWIAAAGHAAVAALAAVAIALPHLVQDDGRLLEVWFRRVKHTEPQPGVLMLAVDQSLHAVALFLLALAISGT